MISGGFETVYLLTYLYLYSSSVDDWVSACRKVEVAGAKCKERKKKTWKECVDKNMKKCLVYIWNGRFSGMCGGTSYRQTSNPSLAWKDGRFQNK